MVKSPKGSLRIFLEHSLESASNLHHLNKGKILTPQNMYDRHQVRPYITVFNVMGAGLGTFAD